MRVSLRGGAGFSLVELMVVVAIVAILAAVAIPSFARFSAKSKQAEAKADLASIYTMEKAFQAEWLTYTSGFPELGYAPSGTFRYEHGFGGDFATTVGTDLPTAYNGPQTTGQYNTTTYCAATNFCTLVKLPLPPTTPPPGTVLPTPSTFVAGANAEISGNGTLDEWTMDNTKLLANIQVGLP